MSKFCPLEMILSRLAWHSVSFFLLEILCLVIRFLPLCYGYVIKFYYLNKFIEQKTFFRPVRPLRFECCRFGLGLFILCFSDFCLMIFCSFSVCSIWSEMFHSKFELSSLVLFEFCMLFSINFTVQVLLCFILRMHIL